MARLEEDLTMDGELERLHGALVDAMRRMRIAPFDGPVTVAEIYQDLVPFRVVRGALGFEMNADYEHTLLRLLSGEGDLARLDPPEARQELRDELDSPNPNVGIFRRFAACDVWVVANEAAVQDAAELESWAAQPEEGVRPGADAASPPLATPPGSDRHETRPEPHAAEPLPVAGSAGEPVGEPVGDDEEAEYELVPVQRRTHGREAGDGGVEAGHCAFCNSSLPERRMLRFCPYCGADQSQRPCGSCGEPLESEWRYCVACGTVAE